LAFASPANAQTPCTQGISGGGNACGPYSWSGWPGSNGYNTYVVDQNVGAQPGSTGQIVVNNPSSWSATANYQSCGGCVQTFTAVQQLTNNWGNGGFNGSSDMPLSKLNLLQVVYSESSPQNSGTQYEFAPDLWTQYSSDIMMWADTSPVRCNGNGLSSNEILGQANLSGQNWTVYRYGGPGSEIIMILDGTSSTDPVATDTCARQTSGTLHVLAALKWVSAHVAGAPSWSSQTMSQFNTGWEITDANGAGTFNVNNMTYKVSVK
jgi:hypothetical protein